MCNVRVPEIRVEVFSQSTVSNTYLGSCVVPLEEEEKLISITHQQWEKRVDKDHCEYVVFERFQSFLTFSCFNYVTRIYHSYCSLMLQKKISLKATLECRLDCDANSDTNARTQVRLKVLRETPLRGSTLVSVATSRFLQLAEVTRVLSPHFISAAMSCL